MSLRDRIHPVVRSFARSAVRQKVDVIDAGAVVESVNGRPVATLVRNRIDIGVRLFRFFFSRNSQSSNNTLRATNRAICARRCLYPN
jgi:hypothetical protein